MAMPRIKRKPAAVNGDNHEKISGSKQLRNTAVPGNNEDSHTHESDELQGRVRELRQEKPGVRRGSFP